VGPIAREIARHLGRSEEEAAWIELAGRLHDIGLLALGVQLAGESALTLDQRREVEQHPALGADILEPLKRWGLPVDAIRAHHERLDGSGYPKAVEDITLEAQILGAADVFQALTSARPWRGASSRQEAIEAMRTGRGFSTEILDALEAVTTSAIEPPGPLPTPPTEDDA
jgi:HD-GYP domain-containing protein (c-di-GMP phosphodiesterase class II)